MDTLEFHQNFHMNLFGGFFWMMLWIFWRILGGCFGYFGIFFDAFSKTFPNFLMNLFGGFLEDFHGYFGISSEFSHEFIWRIFLDDALDFLEDSWRLLWIFWNFFRRFFKKISQFSHELIWRIFGGFSRIHWNFIRIF